MERFWKKTKRAPSGCLEWTGARHTQGYGLFKADGKQQRAHRVAWRLTYGNPGKSQVLHKCDNPPCVDPEHLFLGTAADNAHDRDAKGRTARGAKLVHEQRGMKNPNVKLTDRDVREIRRLALRVPKTQLAVRFGVSDTHIGRIVKREMRKEVG